MTNNYQVFKVGEKVKFKWNDCNAVFEVIHFQSDITANFVDLKYLQGECHRPKINKFSNCLFGIAVYCLELVP